MRKALALFSILGLFYNVFAKQAKSKGYNVPDVKQLGQKGADRIARGGSSDRTAKGATSLNGATTR